MAHRLHRGRRTFTIEPLENRTHLDAALGWVLGISGTSGSQSAEAVRTDGSFLYVAGGYNTTADFDPANSYPDNRDILSIAGPRTYVAKYTTAGLFVWAKDLGTQTSAPARLERDAAGNLLVAGRYAGSANLGNGVTLPDTGLSPDAFVAKLAPNGGALWAKAFSNPDEVIGVGAGYHAQAIGVDSDAIGNVYTATTFGGSRVVLESQVVKKNKPPVPTVYFDSAGNTDILITKHGPSGTLLWAKRVGGSSQDGAGDLAVDAAGNVVVAGRFTGTVDFNPGSATSNLTSGGPTSGTASGDAFLLRLNTGGNFTWAGKLGGPDGSDTVNRLAIDDAGNLFASGAFQSSAGDFDPGTGVVALTKPVSDPAQSFVVKLNPANGLVWAAAFGDAGRNANYGLAVDALGGVYLSGTSTGTAGDFDPGPGIAPLPAGSSGYILKLGVGGELNWLKGLVRLDTGTYPSPTDKGTGRDLAIDTAGNLYAVGPFIGLTDFDPGSSVSTLESGGTPPNYVESGFLLKWIQDTSMPLAFTGRSSGSPSQSVTADPITSAAIEPGNGDAASTDVLLWLEDSKLAASRMPRKGKRGRS